MKGQPIDRYREVVGESLWQFLEKNEDIFFVVAEKTGHILFANPAFQRVTGTTDTAVFGENIARYFVGKDLAVEELLATEGDGSWSEPRLLHLAGERTLPVSYRCRVCSEASWTALVGTLDGAEFMRTREEILAVNNDLSSLNRLTAQERRDSVSKRQAVEREADSLRAQLVQAQKMDSLGRLCGGVAHDFNNLLTVILGSAQMLSGNDGDPDGFAEQIVAASERATNLTRQLLAFSRKQVLELQDHDLSTIVSDSLRLLRPLVGDHIELCVPSEEKPILPVRVDAAQLTQVIMNLAVNACDAMPRGGVLEVGLSRMIESGKPWAVMTVRDSGSGIAADTLPHIFDPFFSTKGAKGTGLGLSTSYGIVKQLGGDITVDSTVGNGAEFRVTLPLSNSASRAGRIVH